MKFNTIPKTQLLKAKTMRQLTVFAMSGQIDHQTQLTFRTKLKMDATVEPQDIQQLKEANVLDWDNYDKLIGAYNELARMYNTVCGGYVKTEEVKAYEDLVRLFHVLHTKYTKGAQGIEELQNMLKHKLEVLQAYGIQDQLEELEASGQWDQIHQKNQKIELQEKELQDYQTQLKNATKQKMIEPREQQEPQQQDDEFLVSYVPQVINVDDLIPANYDNLVKAYEKLAVEYGEVWKGYEKLLEARDTVATAFNEELAEYNKDRVRYEKLRRMILKSKN